MAGSQALWKLENVTKTYTMGQVRVTALQETSMEIRDGELLVILGPSGSGKTTLLNILGGMDVPSGGRVFFDGNSLEGADEKRLTAYRRDVVGFIFQFFNLIPDLTALENVALGRTWHEARFPRKRFSKRWGMADRMNHFPSQMSGGSSSGFRSPGPSSRIPASFSATNRRVPLIAPRAGSFSLFLKR